jgi:SAM-dependent methyltransferase
MALKQHSDKAEMIRQQRENALNYVIPFVEQSLLIQKGTRVLEIGCGEGGVLKPFFDKGCECVGVDLDGIRIDIANDVFATEIATGQMRITLENVFEEAFQSRYAKYFDLIILKDVIEHIPSQETFIPFLKKLLKPKAKVFFGFPPWYMPFGGHQQILKSSWASKLPYYHLLPMPLYKAIIKLAGESEGTLIEMEEIKSTGISIERFEKIVNQSGFSIAKKQWYLINPIYKYKFGLQPRKQNMLFGAVPFLRNFLTTCAYYTIESND